MVPAVAADYGQEDGIRTLVVVRAEAQRESVQVDGFLLPQPAQETGPVRVRAAQLQRHDGETAGQIAFQGNESRACPVPVFLQGPAVGLQDGRPGGGGKGHDLGDEDAGAGRAQFAEQGVAPDKGDGDEDRVESDMPWPTR